MNTAKLELMSHKGIEQWLRKGLKKRNIAHFLKEPWSEQSDASMQLSPSLHLQIGDGYYMVVSSNEATEKNLDNVGWHFEDGTGNLDKEIKKATEAWPVGIVELRHGGQPNE
jgi:hypothetical protein